MKVGIVTFHYAVNPGAFFQASALLDTVRDFGFDAEIINYLPVSVARSQLRMLLIRRNPSVFWGNLLKVIRYSREVREVVSGKRIGDRSQIHFDPNDRILFGSDILWAVPNILHKRDDVYFGAGFGNCRKVAYAASCGPYPPDLVEHADLRDRLARFEQIAVRDHLTRDWVEGATGVVPRIVVDPTLLRMPQPTESSDDKLIVYGYPFNFDEQTAIKRVSVKFKRPLCSIHFYNPWCNEMRLGLGPAAWMESMRAARFVITNTFHGTLISILLGKQFVTITRGLIGSKLDPILRELGLEKQIASDPSEIEPKLAQRIDYADVYERLAKLRSESLDYLKESLS